MEPSTAASSSPGSPYEQENEEVDGNYLKEVAGCNSSSTDTVDSKLSIDLNDLPSIGSAFHIDSGDPFMEGKWNCKPCCFAAKNTCQNGRDCQFCHFDHAIDSAARKLRKRKDKVKALNEKKSNAMEYSLADALDFTALQYSNNDGYNDSTMPNVAFADQSYGQLPWATPDNGISDNVWVQTSSAGFSDSICFESMKIQKPQAKARAPCTSPTCSVGVLPRCPLCGRLREGTCGHPWLDILGSGNGFYEEMTPDILGSGNGFYEEMTPDILGSGNGFYEEMSPAC